MRELMAQPTRPWRHGHFRYHWKPNAGPPDDIAALGPYIDTCCNPSGTAPQTRLVLQEKVKAATAGLMHPRYR
jgi:hypothetical protein